MATVGVKELTGAIL